MLDKDISWFVVMTTPRAEAAAAHDLRRRGYETLYLHTSKWVGVSSGKSRLVKRPYLPGYIFVGLKPDKFANGTPMLHAASTAQGVSRIVHAPGGYPLAVPTRAMEILTANAELPSGLVSDDGEQMVFPGFAGCSVKLGPSTAYWGFMGIIERVDSERKIAILIESFGRQTPYTISPEDVEVLLSPSGERLDSAS